MCGMALGSSALCLVPERVRNMRNGRAPGKSTRSFRKDLTMRKMPMVVGLGLTLPITGCPLSTQDILSAMELW